MNEKTFRKQI
uniref:Uncharacterized protein n=1 Tax=Moniliophthora roreri TaxID=221103 RepID=A0A0W0G0G4_MONRR